MPSLTSFHLLHERVTKRQTDQSLETLGDGFDWVVLETVLDLNGDEIDDAIVDDGMDGGTPARRRCAPKLTRRGHNPLSGLP